MNGNSNKYYQFKKVVIPAMVGNSLEFYDFTLYVFLTPLISPIFFPSDNQITSVFMSLSIFALSFFMRPLGALFFGHIGDKKGRKFALTLSIMLMAIPTCLIGILPSYSSIGILSPILLTLFRLLQGFCTGGEFNGASIFVIENSPHGKKGLAGGFLTSSSIIGALVGSCMASLVSLTLMPFWAWRIAFLLGGAVGFVGVYIRMQIQENEVVLKEIKDYTKTSIPILKSIKEYPGQIIFSLLISGFSGLMFYTSFAFINILLTSFHGWSIPGGLFVCTFGMVCYMLLTPFGGFLADKYGPKKIMIMAAIMTLVLIWPSFKMLNTGNLYLVLLGELLLAIVAGLFQGPPSLLTAQLFPVTLRYSSVALSYCLGLAIFGGTANLLLAKLIKLDPSGFYAGAYISLLSCLALISIFLTKPIKRQIQSVFTNSKGVNKNGDRCFYKKDNFSLYYC